MASYHHHHHHQQQQQNATTPTPITTCSCNPCGHQFPPLNDQCSLPMTDPALLQAIVSHILLQQQQQGGVPFYQTQGVHQQRRHFQNHRRPEQENPLENFVFSSLLSRIEALETSLHKFSSSSSRSNHYSSSYSLRDTAARVIQTHFRAFLVRRSRTLRQLKDLALIKSRFNSLKFAVSKKAHFDSEVVYRKAINLLRKLDSVQGGDPMIRDGKLSIRNDLVKFLEFVGGLAVKKQEVSFKVVKNVISGGNSNKTRAFRDENDRMENLGVRIEKINGSSRISRNKDEGVELDGFHQISDDEEDNENPRLFINGKNCALKNNKNRIYVKKQVVPQPRVKKNVSFAEDGNVYRIVNREPISSDESVSSDENGNVVENLCNEVEEMKGLSANVDEVCSENGGLSSSQSSDRETNPKRNSRTEVRFEMDGGDYVVEDGGLVFAAPVPVKMETRDDLMKNRKAVKFVT